MFSEALGADQEPMSHSVENGFPSELIDLPQVWLLAASEMQLL